MWIMGGGGNIEKESMQAKPLVPFDFLVQKYTREVHLLTSCRNAEKPKENLGHRLWFQALIFIQFILVSFWEKKEAH